VNLSPNWTLLFGSLIVCVEVSFPKARTMVLDQNLGSTVALCVSLALSCSLPQVDRLVLTLMLMLLSAHIPPGSIDLMLTLLLASMSRELGFLFLHLICYISV
jgi:hypothetical protein